MLDYWGICNSKNHIIALTVINTVLDKISKSLNAECILTEGYVIFLYKQHFSGNMWNLEYVEEWEWWMQFNDSH